MGLAHSPRIVTDGLVLCLDAASKRSYPGTGTTWTDLKGGNNGTLTNGPTFSSDNGGSIVLDGSNDAISISDLTFSSAGFTYSFTAKLSSSQSKDFPRVIAGDVEIEWNRSGPHKLRWRWVGSSPSSLDSNSNYFIQDAIHTYTITFTSPNLKLYRDGLLFQTMTFTSSSDTTFNTLMNRSSYNRPVGANFYQCLLYNKTLTPDEILQNYLSTKERYA